jgi:hypothetical protein
MYLSGIFLRVATLSAVTASLGFSQTWPSLGGILFSDPFGAANGAGVVEVCAIAGDLRIWCRSEASTGSGWSDWSKRDPFFQLDARFIGQPVEILNQDGRLEIFARRDDHTICHIWETSRGGPWSRWESMGGDIIDDIGVGINSDGRVEVFGRWSDGELRHIYQRVAYGLWSGWEPLGGKILGRPAVARDSQLCLRVFVLGENNHVFQNSQITPGGSWSGYVELNGGVVTNSVVVARNADDRLEVFGRGVDGTVYHIWQVSRTGPWTPRWESLGEFIPADANVAVAKNSVGTLEVFARGGDNTIYTDRQLAEPDVWSGWIPFGPAAQGTPAVLTHYDGGLFGLLEVFAHATDGSIISRRQTSSGW